jgi:phosphoribosylaminoimidazolecarboxamide formyltransferase/IMP cyclohydrolase
MQENKQKTALISVYNKEGIVDFAKELVGLGWKIISSGGTAKHLMDAGVAVTDVAEITGMPAILSHRVVTLHPKIHGGLLALDTPEHHAELEKYGIPWIDMVCVDLYPLEEEVKNPNATRESVIDKTDIGGPTMLRSAGKGGRIVVCDPLDRIKVLEWLKSGEIDKENFLNNLSAKTEFIISRYCAISAGYHSSGAYQGLSLEQVAECAYGENAYQKPAFLNKRTGNTDPLALQNWEHIAGNPPSYNNWCDIDRMMQTITHVGAGFEKNFNKVPFIAIGAKHGNACGAGVGESEIEAIEKMLLGDLRAIFGGSVMLNFPVDEKIAEELIHKFSPEGKEGLQRRLLDVVSAPAFTPEAIEILSRKKGKCRLVVNKNIEKAGVNSLDTARRFRYVRGGFLQQPNYTFVPDFSPKGNSFGDLILAWAVGCTSNSNTITIVKDGRLVGNGVGQQDRVGAAKLALLRADDAAQSISIAVQIKDSSAFLHPAGGTFRGANLSSEPVQADLEGAVAYSDSFFPFPDAPQVLIDRGIKTIFSTSGSVNDEKIIELCKSKGVELILLPDTEARGFYQH